MWVSSAGVRGWRARLHPPAGSRGAKILVNGDIRTGALIVPASAATAQPRTWTASRARAAVSGLLSVAAAPAAAVPSGAIRLSVGNDHACRLWWAGDRPDEGQPHRGQGDLRGPDADDRADHVDEHGPGDEHHDVDHAAADDHHVDHAAADDHHVDHAAADDHHVDHAAADDHHVDHPAARRSRLHLPGVPDLRPQRRLVRGGYYVHNNMWNRSKYPSITETLQACSHASWNVTATMDDSAHNGEVKTYPNVHKDYGDVKLVLVQDPAQHLCRQGARRRHLQRRLRHLDERRPGRQRNHDLDGEPQPASGRRHRRYGRAVRHHLGRLGYPGQRLPRVHAEVPAGLGQSST